MNLLFLGGAKRVSMARHFKAAARTLGSEARVFSYELSPDVPIAIEGEIIEGLRWTDPAINAHLRSTVNEKAIDVIVPFVDGAVAVAAQLSDVAFVPATTPGQAERMFDKVAADALFRLKGLPVPQSYDGGGDPSRRWIAKPRHGSASKGLITFSGSCQLHDPENYLIQEYIERRREITVDCYVEPASGRICACVPRERLEVSGGEVTRTRTFHRPEVEALARQTLQATGLTGAVTVQLIEDLSTGRLMIMEINPRLGGGAVCAIGAGVDIPKMILQNAAGLAADAPADWRDVEMARYQAEVFFPK